MCFHVFCVLINGFSVRNFPCCINFLTGTMQKYTESTFTAVNFDTTYTKFVTSYCIAPKKPA